MCPQVVVFLGCWGVRWGGAVLSPCWGGAWVGLGDGGSQARAAATGVTAWFVCLVFSFFFLFVEVLWGEVGCLLGVQ